MCLTPGGLHGCRKAKEHREVLLMVVQKSAEAIVAISHDGEGPNMSSCTVTRRSMHEGDAERDG